jgi:hypothetical protein
MKSILRTAGWLTAVLLTWTAGVGAQPPRDAQPPAAPRGTLDPLLPVVPLDSALEELRRDREAAPALERYAAGDYREAARLGGEILERSPQHHGLRFAVANSLAWTGRPAAALDHYRALLGTPYENRARAGMADILRWRDQPDRAEALYLAALEREPGNMEAQAGIALARRDLRPAVTLRLVQTEDNQDLERDEITLTYRRWSADRAWRLEVGVLRDEHRSPLGDSTERGLHGSVWARQLPLSPRLEASIYDSELFGALQVNPLEEQLRIRVGRVNWGRLAFNAAALADGLKATTVGVFGEAYMALGSLRARLEYYDISDGNRILDGEAQATPSWQPLPWGLEWYGGVYWRRAEREDPRYWSPRPDYGLAFVGLQRGWHFERADLLAQVRGGAGFTDTAKTSWTLSLTGRYWLSNDFAIGLEAWSVDAPRPAEYRMQQVAAFLEQLW